MGGVTAHKLARASRVTLTLDNFSPHCTRRRLRGSGSVDLASLARARGISRRTFAPPAPSPPPALPPEPALVGRLVRLAGVLEFPTARRFGERRERFAFTCFEFLS